MDRNARPKVKSVSPVHTLGDTLYVSGSGVVTEIPDADGAVRHLFDLADGDHTVAQIADRVTNRFPLWGDAAVLEALNLLADEGFLENAALSPEGTLDSYSQSRWDRNLCFFESFATMTRSKFELQRRIQDARVVLLGVGGLGSHLLLDLAAVGVQNLRIVDYDTVGLSNLNRQIAYTESDIGRSKVEAAAERVLAFSPRISVDAVHRRIRSQEDVHELVDGFDIAFSVVDRPTMHIVRWVNGGVVSAHVPTIFGGVDSERAVHYTVLPGRSGCVECWRRSATESDSVGAELLAEKEQTDFEGDNAAFGPLVTTLTGLMLNEFVRLITGACPPVATGRLLEMRFADSSMRSAETWPLDASCPVCRPAQDRDAA